VRAPPRSREPALRSPGADRQYVRVLEHAARLAYVSPSVGTRHTSSDSCPCCPQANPPHHAGGHLRCACVLHARMHARVLALHLDDLELHTIRALEETDASAIARDHFL